MEYSVTASAPFRAKRTRKRVTLILRRLFGRERHSAKVLARVTGAPWRTCERWLQGRSVPSAEVLAAAMDHPRFRESFLRALDETR